MGSINIGIIGVGNCAAALVQGLVYYHDREAGRAGLANPVCAGYAVADIRCTAAFDVNRAKIGRDLAEAIGIAPNNALAFATVEPLGVVVREGVLADGVAAITAGHIDARGGSPLAALVEHLRQTETQILVNFLPVGSQQAAEAYAEAALLAGCAFINCMPAAIARSAAWSERFAAAGLPLLGDDLKSQFGATLLHHALVDTLARNGVQLRSTYQIVSGGNMDFLTLQDPARIGSKKATKVHGFGGTDLPADAVHFGAEYVPFLKDRKIAFIRLTGEAFGGTAIDVELKLEIEDSPSAAGNVLDAVRYARAARDAGLAGVIDPVAALLMKAPPQPMEAAAALDAIRAILP
ncbi:MAG TPA: inositol-3-phosphate synthase [Herpetosiphonaceae bacterium]|nr:inositol-3-phosphate synthase [Herpetosiphonaceae bacterium]